LGAKTDIDHPDLSPGRCPVHGKQDQNLMGMRLRSVQIIADIPSLLFLKKKPDKNKLLLINSPK